MRDIVALADRFPAVLQNGKARVGAKPKAHLGIGEDGTGRHPRCQPAYSGSAEA